LFRKLLNPAPSIIVPLLEGDKGIGCASFEPQLATEFCPVEFECGGALL
jgi:hypothetical protein